MRTQRGCRVRKISNITLSPAKKGLAKSGPWAIALSNRDWKQDALIKSEGLSDVAESTIADPVKLERIK